MIPLNDSLNVTLIGDWNKLFIQPEWIAKNVYERDEMDVGVNVQGSHPIISYKNNGVIISPEQDKIIFSSENIEDETLIFFCECISNFVINAYTPQDYAYGFNFDFSDSEDTVLAGVLDSMSDTDKLINGGYEIVSTKISRSILCDGETINMDSTLDGNDLRIHFNEHHGDININHTIKLSIGDVKAFIKRCCEILKSLGYELIGEE